MMIQWWSGGDSTSFIRGFFQLTILFSSRNTLSFGFFRFENIFRMWQGRGRGEGKNVYKIIFLLLLAGDRRTE